MSSTGTWLLRSRGSQARLRHSFAPSAYTISAAVAGSLLVAVIAVERPSLMRPLFAVLTAFALFALAGIRADAAVIATLLILPFLGLARRILTSVADWSETDPLLLVAPFIGLVLFVRLFLIERRSLAPDRLSKLVLAILALSILQAFNPLGESLLAGLAGLLFVAVPLIWFFIGRELGGERSVSVALAGVFILATVIALYGLYQTEKGFPMWDAVWIEQGGYTALSVGGVTRAFGTFSSSAEYASFLAIALVAGVAWFLHGRAAALVSAPLLAWALFLNSSRGIVVVTVVAIALIVGLRVGRPVPAIAIAASLLIAIGLSLRVFEPQLVSTASGTGDVLIQHQVGGLLNPLDEEQSTAPLHWSIVSDGFIEAFQNPIGLGTGATTLAADRFGGRRSATEVDISNVFVSLGILGGALYIGIIILTLVRSLRLYRSRPSGHALAVIAILVVMMGHWLNGAYYALAPLVWFLIGFMNAEWLRQSEVAGREYSSTISDVRR